MANSPSNTGINRLLHVVVAATYDFVLNSQGSTPVIFRDYPHVKDVMFAVQESEEIYDGYMKVAGYTFANHWIAVRDKILKFC